MLVILVRNKNKIETTEPKSCKIILLQLAKSIIKQKISIDSNKNKKLLILPKEKNKLIQSYFLTLYIV